LASANTALRISELDFESIRNNLKQFLRSQNEFIDYDFEGSGLSVLLDILAYNTHYMGYYLNMVGNEMFLDTAQIRSSVISHAKHLNYLPSSKKGAETQVNIKITPLPNSEDTTKTSLVLPKFTKFISEPVDGVNYTFSTIYANTVAKVDNAFTFNNINIHQGEPVTQQYTVSGTNKFLIPSSNVDVDTITVAVQESVTNTSLTIYNMVEDLTQVRSNSTVFFVEENSDANGRYSLTFGDGVLGKQLSNGNIVIVTYLDTVGTYADGANGFTNMQSIGGYTSNIRVSSVSAAAGGSDRETIEQIKFRAPIFYTTQNRAVTKKDYETIITKDYPNIDAVSVWGGEEEINPVYGKIFISLKPKNNYAISLLEKQRIINEIISNRNVLTVTPVIVDPDYTYIQTVNTVYYDPKLTTLTQDELAALVRASILDYNDAELNTFSSSFRISRLEKYVDIADRSITSSDVKVYLQKRVIPTLNSSQNYTINFNVPLKKGVSTNDKLLSYPAIVVTDSTGTNREVYFEEVTNSYTGIDSIKIETSGSGYVSSPTVTITGDGSGATATAKILNGKVVGITVTNRGINYTRALVQITGGGGFGATASAQLQASNGTLRTFYYKASGEKVVVNSAAGTIDYNNGVLVINKFNPVSLAENPYYTNDTLTFNVQPEDSTIFSKRNLILSIDENDVSSIQTSMIAEV
jgi:hypothetical protein